LEQRNGAISFLWNTVDTMRFQRNEKLHSESMFSPFAADEGRLAISARYLEFFLACAHPTVGQLSHECGSHDAGEATGTTSPKLMARRTGRDIDGDGAPYRLRSLAGAHCCERDRDAALGGGGRGRGRWRRVRSSRRTSHRNHSSSSHFLGSFSCIDYWRR
jgi:hypothetical protein